MSARRRTTTIEPVLWLVRAGTNVILVQACDRDEAMRVVLGDLGFQSKPWLARDWIARQVTGAEVAEFEARKSRDHHIKSRIPQERML
jgi:hypothetical protein